MADAFELVCEIEPPVRPDLKHVRHQIGVPGSVIPAALVDRANVDPAAGVDAACEQVLQLRDSGAFDGVHLIPVARYREVAAKLEAALAG